MNDIVLKNYTLLSRDEHRELLAIRNLEQVRQVSASSQLIPFDNHLKFVESLKASDNRYFAVLTGEKIVGGINAFSCHNLVKWGVFFSEEASLLVKSIVPVFFIDYIFKHFETDKIHLDVKKNNLNAIAFDSHLGFKQSGEEQDMLQMSMDEVEFETAKQSPVLKRLLKKTRQYNIRIED